MVITAYDEALDYATMRWVKQIQSGKSDTMPIIGRKRDATEHEPGEMIFGGKIVNNEVELTLDKMIYDAVFIPEIDELIAHFEARGPFAHQLGQSLGSLTSKRIAIMHIKASRQFWVGGAPVDVPNGQPAPGYAWDVNMKTSASALEDGVWKGRQYLMENEISGYDPELRLPPQQYLLFARNFGVENFKAEAGSGDRVNGKLGKVVGFTPSASNHIPNSNITTGLTKYQGDFSTTVGHIGSKVAVGSLERKSIRVVMKDQEERLGTIIIASALSGHDVLRPEASFELATAAR